MIQTALSGSGAAPSVGLVPISTGAIRSSGAAQPTNVPAAGQMTPDVSSGRQATTSEAATTSGRQAAAGEASTTSGHQAATSETPDSTRTAAKGKGKGKPATGAVIAGDKGAKNAIVPQITYEDPGAFHITAEAGYASKHVWRGIDLAQFTSYNHVTGSGVAKADSDVIFAGLSTTYKGFLFGVKYIETIDDGFNPFFAPLASTLDSYSELVLSLNYTRMLAGSDLLQGTFGFDFYYYPNGEFWGVDHQGMLYARLSSPHYKWAQPFIEFFYNIATDSKGNGLANPSVFPPPAGFTSFRGATGSELVEGGGFELGVNGGDRVFSNDAMSLALTYSVSTFYKTGYAFESDGFSQLVLTVGTPITIGSSLTITPSVSYVAALSDVDPIAGAVVPGGGSADDVWNEPGWVAAVKASWRF